MKLRPPLAYRAACHGCTHPLLTAACTQCAPIDVVALRMDAPNTGWTPLPHHLLADTGKAVFCSATYGVYCKACDATQCTACASGTYWDASEWVVLCLLCCFRKQPCMQGAAQTAPASRSPPAHTNRPARSCLLPPERSHQQVRLLHSHLGRQLPGMLFHHLHPLPLEVRGRNRRQVQAHWPPVNGGTHHFVSQRPATARAGAAQLLTGLAVLLLSRQSVALKGAGRRLCCTTSPTAHCCTHSQPD